MKDLKKIKEIIHEIALGSRGSRIDLILRYADEYTSMENLIDLAKFSDKQICFFLKEFLEHEIENI
jgi:hypothetical protein